MSKKKIQIPPGHHPLHPERKLVTRRDFLSSGALGFAGSMVMPSIIDMVLFERSARAGDCPAGGAIPGMMPFIVFDCAGGASLSGNWVMSGQEGHFKNSFAALPSYSRLGLVDTSRFKVDDRFGAPMAAATDQITPDIESKIFASLYSMLPDGTDRKVTVDATTGLRTGPTPDGSPLIAQKVRMGVIAHTSLSDSQSNLLSAVSLVTAAGAQGTRVKNGLGTRQSNSAGNSDVVALDPSYRPMGVNSVDSLNIALSYGPAYNGLPVGVRDALAKALVRLTGSQTKSLLSMNLGEQIAELTRCGYLKNTEYTGEGGSIDARTDADAQTIYGITTGSAANSAAVMSATLVKAALEGSSGPAVLTIGGCDYHSGNRTDGDNKDTEIGTQLARAILLAAKKNVAFAFQIFTDGGISSDENTRVWRGDDNDKSASIFGVFDPSGAREMISTQIGRYTAGQGADRNHYLGTDPARVAHTVFLNYLASCGKRSLFDKIDSNNRMASDHLDRLRLFADKG